jgi:hypothetical protein
MIQGYLMMSTIKALLPGTAITLLISALVYRGGTRGGVLAVERAELLDVNLYWSWPLFLATFCLARALLWMIEA